MVSRLLDTLSIHGTTDFLQSIKNTVKSMTRATNLTKKYIKGHIKNTVKSMTRAANLTKKYIKRLYFRCRLSRKKKIGRQLGVDRNLDVEASDIYHNEKARMEAVEQNAFQLKTDRSDLQGITKREADKTQVQPKKSQSHKKKRVNSSSTNHQATTGANNVF